MSRFVDLYRVLEDFPRPVIFGFWFCLGATYVLWSIDCPQPQSGCSGSDPHAVALLAGLIELVLIVLLTSPRGRWFDLGFLIGLVTAAVVTGGVGAAIWAAPSVVVGGSTRSVWAPLIAMIDRHSARKEWLGLHRTQHPTVVHGARLVNAVEGCAEQFREADSAGSYPRSESEVTTPNECREIAPLALDADSAPARFAPADNGWRWSYVAGPVDASGRVTSYRVRAFEDPALERPAPTFSSDERGAIRKTEPGAPPAFAASPVPALLTLRRCLTRIPEFERSHASVIGYYMNRSDLAMVQSVCPELDYHLGRDSETNERGTLALSVGDTPGRMTDTVAVYTTEVVRADRHAVAFAIRAWPRYDTNPDIHGGARRFFVADDGSVHVRTGSEMATADDPVAAECLPGGGVDCAVSPLDTSTSH